MQAVLAGGYAGRARRLRADLRYILTEAQYLALYCPADLQKTPSDPHGFLGGLTHIGVCVRDLVACEARVKKARFTLRAHAEY